MWCWPLGALFMVLWPHHEQKVWCGTHGDMGGAAWNFFNMVKHQKTEGEQKKKNSGWNLYFKLTATTHLSLSISLSLSLSLSHTRLHHPTRCLRTGPWASWFLSLLVCRLTLLPRLWADETLFSMATGHSREERESICELALHKSSPRSFI